MDRFEGGYTARFEGQFVLRRRLVLRHSTPVFEFHLDPARPLTFHLDDGSTIRPNRTFAKYDFGSVPLILQGLVSPLCSPRGFACHDSFYVFHHWWTAPGIPVPISRKQADNMLYRMMRADHCRHWTAVKAWLAVRAFGHLYWDRAPLATNEARRQRLERLAESHTPHPA